MKIDYRSFFNNYRIVPITNEADLLFQVGWTINKSPISKDQFNEILHNYDSALKLSNTDILIDLCCGNGVITKELSRKCKSVVAIDFSDAYIKNAKEHSNTGNINYYASDVLNCMDILKNDPSFTSSKTKNIKILMSYSFGYFVPGNFERLIQTLNTHLESFTFYITGIPDYHRHTVVFNTLKKRSVFLLQDRLLKKTGPIGRFWKFEEIEKICKTNGLLVKRTESAKNLEINNYRFSVLIEK